MTFDAKRATVNPQMRGATSRTFLGLAALAATAVLLLPAAWNGYAIIYPDTGGYLARPIERTLELNRSAIYGAFIYPGLPFNFWPILVLQSAAGVWIVALMLRVFGLLRPLTLFGVTLALAIVSALPWYAVSLMPDIWLPYAILALYLLTFRTHELKPLEIALLIAVIALAIGSHTASLVLCVGLSIALGLAPFLIRLPPAQLKYPFISAVAGLLLTLCGNFAIGGQFGLTPGGSTFMFGRMVEDGIVARYLAEHCPDPSVRLCVYRDQLEDNIDDWIFAPGNVLGKLGGWRDYEPEAKRLNREMLRLYPGMKLLASIRSSARQFVMLKTEVSLNRDYNAPALDALRELAPQIMPPLLAAKQQANMPAFIADLATLNILHVAVAWLSLLVLAAMLLFPARFAVAPPFRALAFTVFVALAGNAVICGTFSSNADRYQSRIVWLAPLALMVMALARRGDTRLGKPEEFP